MMKQSKFNGKYIFDEMLKLQREIEEIGRGLDCVESDFNTQHIAYRLLKDQYEAKRREFQQLEIKEYAVVVLPQPPAPGGFDF
jgi:hypothetical protein